jgi:C-terminal processing protease CtpA/Prc
VGWDKLYLESIPKIQATKSTAEYYRELQALCALLRDGHTSVIPPSQVATAQPPLVMRLVEGHVMVLETNSPSLEQQGLTPGMEIVAIEGEAPPVYAKRELEPYLSASTPQDLETREFSAALLRGPAKQPVRLKLRTPSGELAEKTIARSGYTDVQSRPGFEWRLLPGRVAYVAVNRFDQEQVVSQFRDAFPRIADSDALILDLRHNGGGSSSNAFAILQFLLLKPTLGQRQVMRSYNPTLRAREGIVIGTTEEPGFPIEPRAGEVYRNPVVVLTSAATYSAAEDFMVAWQTSGRGKTIGEATGGSTGQPVFIQLPGGGSARICSKRDTFPDGREWEGVGIQPDIPARPTVSDVVAGKDTVLQRALEFLKP